MDDNIANFVAITGSTPEVANRIFEMASGDFEAAISIFYENPEVATALASGAATASSSAPRSAAPARSRVGREDDAGVIHIDSDEDVEDMDMQFKDDLDDDADEARNSNNAQGVAARAQEEEDAAMAKRLQEELYSENRSGGPGGDLDPEGIRAPIARTTETLVAPDPSWGGDDDLESSFLQQMRSRRPARSGGPFSHQIWGEPANRPAPEGETANTPHARRLEDLFRPPYDLMESCTWDEARSMGKEDQKWLLVNLQDMSDFNCQALNRDVWKDAAVRELVMESFIFLQYDKDYPDAQEYVTFYFPNQSHENPDNYPHVSIIDPRTGEQVKVWSGRPFPSASEFHSDLAEFLDRYSLAANRKNPVAKATVRKPQPVDVDRMTEDEMLEMALKNSMAQGQSSERHDSNPNVFDPDSLTKSPAPEEAGKGKEPETAAASPFAQISSTNPHTEPENNPASTTRIQFRHPNGRVIRRFNLQDPVRRIFEWLKAEPLEGQEGQGFELKTMPQGQDLLNLLDGTIQEAGLKQGTVMIEFVSE